MTIEHHYIECRTVTVLCCWVRSSMQSVKMSSLARVIIVYKVTYCLERFKTVRIENISHRLFGLSYRHVFFIDIGDNLTHFEYH